MEAANVDTAHEELRPLMFSIAYRMTGSVGDAEDIVQEAFIRAYRAEESGTRLESPQAFLATTTTRLAIDHLRSARVRRESYIGTWLPEPLVADTGPGPAEHAEMADSLSLAFLVLLESLSPVERAVFLLREVFGYEYDEIARTVDKSEPNCRQIFGRARRRIDQGRPRFDGVPASGRRTDRTGSWPRSAAVISRRSSTCSRPTWSSSATAAARARPSPRPFMAVSA